MEDTNEGLLRGSAESKEAVTEEKTPASEFVEEPLIAQSAYFFKTPINWAFTSADLLQFARRLHETFELRLEGVELPEGVDPQTVLLDTILQGNELTFKNGVLPTEDQRRATVISSLTISTQKIYVDMRYGTTAEAELVIQKTLELLSDSSGWQLSLPGLAPQIISSRRRTSTNVDLGIDLIDLFSDRFKDFVQNDLAKSNSIARKMGEHVYDKELRRTVEDTVVVSPQIHSVAMRVTLFNPATGLAQDCPFTLEVLERLEQGQGKLWVTSELDSELHTQLIKQLRSAILSQAEV